MALFKHNPDLKFIKEGISGNIMVNGLYSYDGKDDRIPMMNLLKWVSRPNPQRSQKRKDSYTPEVSYNIDFLNTETDSITWLGHSTFFIKVGSKKLITDPVLYDLSIFLKKKTALPCSVDNLKDIDYILISHGHRDHLDERSIKTILKYSPDVEVLCPLGFTSMMRSWGVQNIQEASWWQMYKTAELEIVFLPAKHWNRRGLFDFNKTLWGSFAIKRKNEWLYFAGDSGFGEHYSDISSSISNFSHCMMPIGAYKPDFVMKEAHMSPSEAIDAFHIIQGKEFIPMHYGTFDLSDEPASEPIEICNKIDRAGKLDGVFHEPIIGKSIILRHN